MRVGLVSYIPDQSVIGGIEYIVEGYCQLDGPQTGGKMAAAGTDTMDQEFTQFLSQLGQLTGRQAAQVRRRVDGFKERVLIGRSDHLRQFILWRRRTGNAVGQCCKFAPRLAR